MNPCFVCNHTSLSKFLDQCPDYYLGLGAPVDYYQCPNCKLVQQSPIPNPNQIQSWYQNYPIHQKKSIIHTFLRKIMLSEMYFTPDSDLLSKSGTLLDFGCGDGSYLESIQKTHPQLKLIGFEPNAQHAERLQNRLSIPIYSDLNRLAADLSGRIDQITFHTALEHIHNPIEVLAFSKRLLKPDGKIFITLPKITSYEFKLFRKNWHNLDAPRHLHFLEKDHLTMIGKKLSLLIYQDHAVSFPNGIAGSIPVALTGKFRFFIFALFLPLGWVLSRLIPGGIWAYKLRNHP